MIGDLLFQGLFLTYLGGTVLFVFYLLYRKNPLMLLGRLLMIGGLLFSIAYMVWRGIAAGRAPFSNLFEFMLSFSIGIVLIYLVMERLTGLRALGLVIAPLNMIFVGWAAALPKEIGPLVPALRSFWMSLHVPMAIFAYGGYATAFALGILFMVKERWKTPWLPEGEVLDRWIYTVIGAAMPFLTLLIVLGAIWAEEAWGTYWSWDPKEVWSLITWLIYAGYLHAKTRWGSRYRKLSAYAAVFGFVAVIFTYVGVNLLLSGLHSYN